MPLLAGIRVLDLSLLLPGPFCTMLLADYGADVIKVDEPSPRARNPLAAEGEEPGMCPADRYLNRGKRSMTLNLKAVEGREIFRTLADKADVVVEGFRPGVAGRLGVDYAALSARNPGLVYCSISGFGQTGPLAQVPAHDLNYISHAGILGSCGRPGEPPTIPPVQLGDLFGGGMMALSGILMALLSRHRTGKGTWLDVSMVDGAMALLSIHAADYLARRVDHERGRMPLTGMYPCYDVYRCAGGGYLSVAPLEAVFWKNLLAALGREDLLAGQYATGEDGERVRAELGKAFAAKTRDEWVRFFEGTDVCVAPVLSLPEAFDHPNAGARRMVVAVASPLGGLDLQPGLPVKAVGEEESVPGRPPRLGEHDDEILKEIGYDDSRIAALRDKGVIRRR